MFLANSKNMDATCEQVYCELWILQIGLVKSPSFSPRTALAKKFNAAINIYFGERTIRI
jgi:hypothetical protein